VTGSVRSLVQILQRNLPREIEKNPLNSSVSFD